MSGLDSAFAPTLVQAQAARAAGYTWWGFYLPKLPNTDPLNGWTVGQMDILKEAQIIPIPICVPSPPAPADPIATASGYVELAQQYGLTPKVSVCYNGEGISVTGPVWLPRPSINPPISVGTGSAIQWSTGTFAGLSVDFNVNAPDWPANQALVCDLEHNVSYTSEWYATFQNEVTKLTTPSIPPQRGFPLPFPAGSAPFKDISIHRTDTGNIVDIGLIDNEGNAWITFYDEASGGWSLPQRVNA